MRILIVEDEHKIANAIKHGLEQEAFAVDVEFNADSGLSSAQEGNYDLLILDRMLPGSLDGLEICQTLRNEGKHVPIIMLTAKDQIRERVRGLDAGADDYLIKPFAFEELLARVRSLLRRPHENLGTVLDVDGVKLNPDTFEAEREGRKISLTHKEYALLEYLMRNHGRVLTKDNIVEHVWDYDADILPNTVEVYIGYLRRKIDTPFKSPALIHTIRGFGYKFGLK